MTVARLGTVRAAAAELGVHRATVTRHIDALEASLGCKLFLRHSEGYSLTPNGSGLKRLAEETEELLQSFEDDVRKRTQSLSGTLTLASLARTGELMLPVVSSFRHANPHVKIQYLVENSLTRLELGYVDIAIRVGPSPKHPDYVVMPLDKIAVGLFASSSYLEQRGVPADAGALADHDFVAIEDAHGTLDVVQLFGAPHDKIVYTANDPTLSLLAVRHGVGLGTVAKVDAHAHGLVEVLADSTDIQAEIWLLTHVDAHRAPLVQAFLKHLRAHLPLQKTISGRARTGIAGQGGHIT